MSDGPRSFVQRAATPLLALGGMGASFGLAACCSLPFYLAALGVGTAWLGDIGIYAEFHRPTFFIVAVIGLVGGAALLWFLRKTMPRPLFWLTLFGLLLGIVFMFLGTREG